MKNNDKRVFPRMDLACPVLYRLGNEKPWKVGKMRNLSATGIQIVAAENPAPATPIYIQIKPGSKKSIPAISASGKVVRSEPLEDGIYAFSCSLTDISNH